MEERLADVSPEGRDITEHTTEATSAEARQGATCVASRTPIPKVRYTVADFDRTRCGKFHQMIVDRLHSRGD